MLTLNDVLSIRHPEAPRWSPDGKRLAFSYNVNGVLELWSVAAAGGDAVRVSAPGQKVGAWAWAPDGSLTYASAGEVWSVSAAGGEAKALIDGTEPVAEVKWSPDGSRLGVVRGGRLSLLGFGAHGPALQDLDLPGKVSPTFHWSPSGKMAACAILDERQRDVAVLEVASGRMVWRSRMPECVFHVAWVGKERLSLVRQTMDATRREYLLVSLPDGGEEVLEEESNPRGLMPEMAPVVSPAGDAIALLLQVDGWRHIVLRDLANGTRTVVLPGAHEDVGHAYDRPAFSPDGRYLYLASSKVKLQHRHIWRYDRERGDVVRLTPGEGTFVNPVCSPDGAFVAHIACGPKHSAEVAVMRADGSERRYLTRSMPEAWTREPIVRAEHVRLKSQDGTEVHADLFLPHGFDPSRKYPALVYIHGGPMRQMRDGWHPNHPYAVFYSYNQYVLHREYVVLSVDYRGGVGYGVAYEQANYLQFGQGEMEDCVAGADYLKSLPYIDGDRLAIWGLSYGGYMTLAALTKRPEVFALGINIAGVWDQEQWAEWRAEKDLGYPLYFVQRWGGPRCEANEAVYRQISPRNFVAGLRAPLLNLHGTDDEAVDFAQLDAIVRDCTEHGKDFATAYYPGETHMFTKRKTWEDAFRRMDRAFDRYLKCEPGQRPPAMI